MSIRFTYRQEHEGSTWESEPFEAETDRHVRQGVIAGFLSGHARCAVEIGTDRVIYALDRTGHEVKGARITK